MRIIGLTGSSGAGKGMLSNALRDALIPCLDTDALYHELVSWMSPCVSALRDAFGDSVLNEDGSLDRRALSDIVFCGGEEEKDRLALLNKITHRFVLEECRAWIEEKRKEGYKAAVIDAPLLYESGFDQECDTVIAVISPRKTRIERIIRRDGISRERAEARIDAQPCDQFYTSRADYSVLNDGTADELAGKARTILQELSLL